MANLESRITKLEKQSSPIADRLGGMAVVTLRDDGRYETCDRRVLTAEGLDEVLVDCAGGKLLVLDIPRGGNT